MESLAGAVGAGELDIGDTINTVHRDVDVIMTFPIKFREDAGEVCD